MRQDFHSNLVTSFGNLLFRSYILSFDFHWMGDDVWGGRPMIGQWIGETQDKVADAHLAF